jgi:hypothetical protein
MTMLIIGGIVRAITAGLGGYLVAKGQISDASVQELGGALLTVTTIAWSIIAKKRLP